MSLRIKTLFLLFSISMVPLFLAGLLAVHVSKKALEEQFARSALEYLGGIKKRVNEIVYHDVERVRVWAEELAIYRAKVKGGDYLQDVLSKTREGFHDFYYLAYVSGDGKIRSTTEPVLRGLSVRDRPEFQQALRGQVALSQPLMDDMAGNHALLVYSPVFAAGGSSSPRGVLIGAIRWSTIVETVSSETINGEPQGAAQHIMMARRDGTVTACADTSEMFADNLLQRGLKSAALSLQGHQGSLMERTEHDRLAFATYTGFGEQEDIPKLDWILVMYQDPASLFASVSRLKTLFYLCLAVSAFIMLFISLFVADRMTRPIRQLVRATREAAKWNFDNPVKIRGKDEFAELCRSFNQMFHSLKASMLEREMISAKLMQSSKLASIGTLAAGVAHEINNPLAIVSGNLGLLREGLESEPGAARLLLLLERQEKAIHRIAEVINGLLRYARADSKKLEVIDIHRMVEETLAFVADIFAKSGIRLETRLGSARPFVAGTPGEFQQVVMNFITNARDAMGGGKGDGLIRIETEDLEDKVQVRFIDNGSGIPPAKIGRIFDPFFTTKGAGKGTGLGLSIVHSIVESMQGAIEVRSKVGEGTEFTLTFPRAKSDAKQPVVSLVAKSGSPDARRKRILIVDDEEEIRELLRAYLDAMGFQVDEADDGDVALRKIQEQSYDFVITDFKMPRMNGDVLMAEARKLQPGGPRFVAISGGIDTDFTSDQFAIVRQHAEGFLKKPFGREELQNFFASLESGKRVANPDGLG